MAYQSDFSPFKLFVNHFITIYDEKNILERTVIKIPSLRDKFENLNLNIFYAFFNQGLDKFKGLFSALKLSCNNEFEALKCIYQIGYIKELNFYYTSVTEALKFFFNSEVTYINDTFTVVKQNRTLDYDLFNYVMYILRLAEGMNIEPPRTFKTDAERQRYEKILEQEEKIRKIRATGTKLKGDNSMDPMKGFVSIMVAFPQYTIDMILDFTTCQIVSLQQYAARILKYDIEKRAYAAGNLKKLKSFLE